MVDHEARGAWFHDVPVGPAPPTDARGCQRAGCRAAATVTLSFRYDARQASLVDLSAERDPAYYDLCGAHADVLIVPRGWERLDRRTPAPEPEPEPDADAQPAAPGMDRYAVLTAQLPRLAEAWGVAPTDAAAPAGPAAPAPADRATDDPDPAAPVTTHGPYEPVTRSLLDDEAFELEGQLQMPIESEARGVVVALTRSRSN